MGFGVFSLVKYEEYIERGRGPNQYKRPECQAIQPTTRNALAQKQH